MSQAPLFLALHLLGTLLCLAFGPRSRPALCCALGFAVGLATAVMLAMLLLLVGLPYRPTTLTIAALIPAGLAIAVLWRRRPDRRTGIVVAGWAAAFGVVVTGLVVYSFSSLSYDSHEMVMLGRVIAADGDLAPGVLVKLQSWGVFQVISQSLVTFVRPQFLYGLQPVLGLSFAIGFALTLWHGAIALGASRSRLVAALVALITVALFTIGMVQFHLYYIHTNLGAALYLFGFVTLFWLAEVTRDPEALPVAFLCLLAFALTRIEAPFFALVCLILTVLPSQLPRRALTGCLAGFAIAVCGWFWLLSRHVPPTGDFLTPNRCYLVIAGVAGFFLYWLATDLSWLRRFNRLAPTALLVAGTVAGLVYAFATRRAHMMASVRGWDDSLRQLPQWGWSWYALIALLLAGLLQRPPPNRRIFTVGIPVYFAFVLLLVLGRKPYYHSIGDSANRMTLHILPLIFFYVGIKLIATLARRTEPG